MIKVFLIQIQIQKTLWSIIQAPIIVLKKLKYIHCFTARENKT